MVIKEVIAGSIAEEGGILPGESLVSVNGNEVRDLFDYHFLAENSELELLLLGQDGNEWILDVEKEEYEDLGITFEEDGLPDRKSCCNRCIFCFIDQLPSGMREALYFKDDDSRLSFINGNYVTLTNMRKADLDRIIRYKMSPVNISVHATDPTLRAELLGLKKASAAEIVSRIRRLTENRIEVNAQIVLCKGRNDGTVLEQTLRELGEIGEGLNSISVVPVGLTKYREGLTPLSAFDAADARAVLDQVHRLQQVFLRERGSRLVYPADEFFLLADVKLPGKRYYEGFPQLENGVGMLSLFLSEFNRALNKRVKMRAAAEKSDKPAEQGAESRPLSGKRQKKALILTGTAAYPYINSCVQQLNENFSGLDATAVPVTNTFFGESVTVTGLLTGSDIVKCLKEMKCGEETVVFLSKSMLKYDSELFLDDLSLVMLRKQLKVDIMTVENSGEDFVRKILQ